MANTTLGMEVSSLTHGMTSEPENVATTIRISPWADEHLTNGIYLGMMFILSSKLLLL